MQNPRPCAFCGTAVVPPYGAQLFKCGKCGSVNQAGPQLPLAQQLYYQQPQQPQLPQQPPQGMPCPRCTLVNPASAFACQVCNTPLRQPAPQPALQPPPQPQATASPSGLPWSCRTCTLTNPAHLKKCGVCGYTRSGDGSSSGGSGGGSSSGGGGGGTLAALQASPQGGAHPGWSLGAGAGASPSSRSGGDGPQRLDPRIVFMNQGDGCSPREDERCRATYADIVRDVRARGPYALYSDPAFAPCNAHLGAGAEVSINFTGHGKVGVPILWRRPDCLADEAGVFQPGSSADPAADLAALVKESSSGSGSSGGGGEAYRPPPPRGCSVPGRAGSSEKEQCWGQLRAGRPALGLPPRPLRCG